MIDCFRPLAPPGVVTELLSGVECCTDSPDDELVSRTSEVRRRDGREVGSGRAGETAGGGEGPEAKGLLNRGDILSDGVDR